MFTPHYVLCVTCHVSHVTCHMSRVTCHVSHVKNTFFYNFFKKKNYTTKNIGQSGGASRWRVCYQRGLPRLVWEVITNEQNDHSRVKYFCEALGFKYHLGYLWGVPRPPSSLTPLNPYRGGPMGARGGMSEGGDIMSLTPKCDMFLESPRPNLLWPW